VTTKKLRKKLDKMNREELEKFAIHYYYLDMIGFFVGCVLTLVIIGLCI
jgi:hypothetical protein